MAEESMKDFEREINASLRKVEEGDILSGTIIGVSDDEVTLDLSLYAPGIVKMEEMSNDPGFSAEKLHYGEKLRAKVLSVDDGNGNISLSVKQADDELSWDTLRKRMEEKEVFSVKVREAVKGGLVAYVDGLRGFIPASKASTGYVEDLSTFVGKELPVILITVDEKKKRVVMSARAVLEEQAREEREHKIANLAPGTVVEGTVESIMPYGAFVDIGDGISGLVHISQVATRRIGSVNEVLKEGQSVRAKILNTNNGKVSLSIRALEEDEAPAREKKEQEKRNLDVEKYSDHGSATTSLGDILKGLTRG